MYDTISYEGHYVLVWLDQGTMLQKHEERLRPHI